MSGLYLYGVTRARALPRRLSARGIALVRSGDRAAVVSPVDASPVEATRRNLLAHADVVEELHAKALVLPARFGIVLPDRAAAVELLASEELGRLLDEHESSAELTLKGDYDEAVLGEVAAGLGGLREAYRRSPTLENGLALGEAVAAALAARRSRDTDRVLAAVEPLARAVRVGEPVGEHGALNLALLVDRDRVDDVSRALEDLGAKLSPPLRFRLVGPLPPYSFVDLALPVAA